MPIHLWKKIVTPVVNGIRDFKEATTEASSTVTGMPEVGSLRSHGGDGGDDVA